jgi:pimeloyl-ACP methyl ester carboxylesterase
MLKATSRFGALTGLETVGSSTRPRPVLFVHGWWGGAWVWDRFMERFAQRGHACFAINLRGYHDSKPVADMGNVSFDDHLEDIRTAMDALDRPVLVTHSASGLIALKLAETQPIAAAVHLVPSPPAGIFSLRAARVYLRYMPLILRGKPVLLNKRDMFDANLNRLPPDEQEAVYAKMVPAPGRQARQMMLGISVSPKKVSGPRLIQSGTDDRLVPASVHRKTARKFGSTYREYAGHGHYLMREPGWEVIADDAASWIEEHAR